LPSKTWQTWDLTTETQRAQRGTEVTGSTTLSVPLGVLCVSVVVHPERSLSKVNDAKFRLAALASTAQRYLRFAIEKGKGAYICYASVRAKFSDLSCKNPSHRLRTLRILRHTSYATVAAESQISPAAMPAAMSEIQCTPR